MKIGTFNIHDYLGKLYEQVNEEDLTLNEEEGGKLSDNEGIIIPDDNRKAYDWLKKEYHKGKTEVKVEISSHEFKPSYNLDTNLKDVKEFKPGMYGNTSNDSKREKAVPFPETKFPGSGSNSETKSQDDNKIDKPTETKKNNIKVQFNTKPREAKKPEGEQEDKKEESEDTKK